MLPRPAHEIDRTLVALGFLSEIRQAERPIDCALTSRDKEELRRRGTSGDEDAFAELTRREPIAA